MLAERGVPSVKIITMRGLRRYAKEVHTDDDGIWVHLKPDFWLPNGYAESTIHGDTVEEVLEEAQYIEKRSS